MQKNRVESELRSRQLVENSRNIISVEAPDTTIHYISPAVTSLHGYDPAELTGRTAIVFIHPEDRVEVQKRIDRAFAGTPRKGLMFFWLLHKDGRYGECESATHSIKNPETGKITEYYIVSGDVSARKKRLIRVNFWVQSTGFNT